MDKALTLQKLVFLDENKLNPFCHVCNKELSGFLISQKKLVDFFSPSDIGWLVSQNLIRPSERYKPQLIIFLCKYCSEEERKKNDKI